MAKIEEIVFENELDTDLITSTCLISMYNSMKKSEVMEGVLFLCILARQEAQGIDIITYFLTAPLHYSTEIWAQFSPLF